MQKAVTQKVATVTGTIDSSALGATLMHEHLIIGYAGWESDTAHPGPGRDEMHAICKDRIQELQARGVSTLLDPCPSDLGRDVEFMAEVAARTGFNVICATGLYKEDEGGTAYWKFRQRFGDGSDAMAEVFIRDLTHGIGETGVRAGVIKVATGNGAISDYERMILDAAAKASVETGAPITTHTDQGTCGDEQQRILVDAGVPANRIIIGHCCGTSDSAYHLGLAEGGSYLGFDRFGLDIVHPDSERIAALVRLVKAGAAAQVVVSHDTVWCWRGQPIPQPELFESLSAIWQPTHFHDRIVPQLLEAGVTEEQIRMMLEDNPRRFFEGGALPAIAG
jgi:phosphotriesterase-related protein